MECTRLIVAGIGTDVGKTVVSAILVEALQGCYWKPVQCGLPRDSEWIETICQSRSYPECYCLKTPCSPHLAARIEGRSIQAKDLIPPPCEKPLVIEGTGGLLVPLNAQEVWFDAAKTWKAKWILVHRHYIGSLNHFLLSIAFLKQNGISLAGIIFNGEGDLETEEMLLQKAGTNCIGRLAWQQLSRTTLQNIAKKWRPCLGL